MSYINSLFFDVVYTQVHCCHNVLAHIPCVSPNSISLLCICGCSPVSEICEFNQKKMKKMMNNSENGYFQFDTFSIVQMVQFYGIVTIMSKEVQT